MKRVSTASLLLLSGMLACQQPPEDGVTTELDSAEVARIAKELVDSLAATGITGFASLPWGSTLEEIVAEWGAPTDTTVSEGLTLYVYDNETVLDQEALMAFVLDQQHGLVKGGYHVTGIYGEEEAERVFQSFRAAISERYPDMPRTGCPADKPCGEMVLLPVEAAEMWQDMWTNTAITLGLIKEGFAYQIRADYESAAFFAEKQQAADRRF